ncbi:MAG: deoxyribose-phosphate aldolase [Bacteroidales bacterium]|nr:deoxyribose-phosphate aldolase [Bacteroidales bacterium]
MMDINTVRKEIADILNEPLPFSEREICARLLGFLDLTTLEGTDTQARVRDLCQKALRYQTGGVCVYPYYAGLVAETLKGSGIRTACVVGGFPASQLPLELKLAEARYVLAQGADEMDMVLAQGAFLEGDSRRAGDEIKAMKAVCGDRHLKVILETGALPDVDAVAAAARLAISSGADFIKTSTGKIAVSATPEAFYVMLRVIKEHHEQGGRRIGIKPAGGISTVEAVLPYFRLLYAVLGEDWLRPDLFRIGASRLADALAKGAGL